MQLDFEAKEQFQQKFIILNLLGKGSFGFVYECIDRFNNEVYAVKVISKNNVKKNKIECLRQQAKILSTIEHPNIVKVYEFVWRLYGVALCVIYVRFIEQLIRKKWENGQKFTDDQAATIMSSLFKSVNHIHSVSIIHRDIKPENILLPNENDLDQIKMADFGLSTKLDFHYPKTATSKCGTMLYMAPEILCNYTYTKSVDIWSLSIIMFMLFNGKHPFYQSKMASEEYKRKIKIAKFPSLSNKLAQDFISKISKIEANQRYSAQQALKHPWLTRNSEDEIPLSLHQSYSGFEKSHQISLVLDRINKVNKEFDQYAFNIFKSSDQKGAEYPRNLQSRKQLNNLNNLNLTFEKQNHEKKNKEKINKFLKDSENDNPAIQKLNTIFDTLFGKRSKLQLKTYSEGVTQVTQPKQHSIPAPDISNYKEKIQVELERAVKQYKNTVKPSNRRILPLKIQTKHQERYLQIQYQKQQQKNLEFTKFSSTNLKNKYRRRPCPMFKIS